MADSNPFGAPTTPSYASPSKMASNPFDPIQQDPFAAAPLLRKDSASGVSSLGGMTANNNPFGASPPQQQQQQPPMQQQAYGQPPVYGQPAPPAPYPGSESPQVQQQQPPYSPQYAQGGPPQPAAAAAAYGGYPPQTQNPATSPFDSALVPAQQQSNPYAVAPQPAAQDPFGQQQQQQQQALVPAAQQNSQWGMQSGGGGPPPGGNTQQGSAASFDPFAAPPPPPAPAPVVVVVAPPPPQQPEPTMPPRQEPAPEFAQQNAAAAPYPSNNEQYGTPYDHDNNNGQPPAASAASGQAHFAGDEPGRQYENAAPPAADRAMEGQIPRNRYSQELSRVAPTGASPLPKAELVGKKGFVLSRISFRTIVMKKWKQSFWVQYGAHTMVWFRSRTDFDDWLNNPYHNQSERNFLIKLAVNFVNDLYKPNVRGYQVTQCRTKPYGKKMVRQFKLERWMDYGPTIAAAFGSYNPKEVDDLREALVECMRNTPLNGGIRATGAVRQPQSGQEHGYNEEGGPPPGYDGQEQNGFAQAPGENGPPAGEESVASEKDLLDLDNWDDVPAGAPPDGSVGGYPGAPPPQQQQYADANANAMVPVAYAPQAYPGAPPPQQQYQQQAPPQQQYPGAPPPQQYQQQAPPQQQYPGAPPPQQQYQQQPPPSPQQQQQQQPQYQDPWAPPQPAG